MLFQLCQFKYFAISREQTWVAWKFILSLRKSCKLYYAPVITNFKIESWISALCTFCQHSLIVRREKWTISQKSISVKETLLSSLLPFHTKIGVESLFERCQKKRVFRLLDSGFTNFMISQRSISVGESHWQLSPTSRFVPIKRALSTISPKLFFCNFQRLFAHTQTSATIMIKYHFWTSEPRIPFSCWYWQSLQSCCPGNYQIVVWAFLCWQFFLLALTNPLARFVLVFAFQIFAFSYFSFFLGFSSWQLFLLSVTNPPTLLLNFSSLFANFSLLLFPDLLP